LFVPSDTKNQRVFFKISDKLFGYVIYLFYLCRIKIKVMQYYRVNSTPLERVPEERIKAGELVYTELGKCVKKIYIGDDIYFIEVVESVLNEGETMTELTPLQLSMFWKLSKNKLEKHESKDRGTGKHIFH
jgi:hypothetical protein